MIRRAYARPDRYWFSATRCREVCNGVILCDLSSDKTGPTQRMRRDSISAVSCHHVWRSTQHLPFRVQPVLKIATLPIAPFLVEGIGAGGNRPLEFVQILILLMSGRGRRDVARGNWCRG